MLSWKTVFMVLLGTATGLFIFLLCNINNFLVVSQKGTYFDRSDSLVTADQPRREHNQEKTLLSRDAILKTDDFSKHNKETGFKDVFEHGRSDDVFPRTRHQQIQSKNIMAGSVLPFAYSDETIFQSTSPQKPKSKIARKTNLSNRWQQIREIITAPATQEKDEATVSMVLHPWQETDKEFAPELFSRRPETIEYFGSVVLNFRDKIEATSESLVQDIRQELDKAAGSPVLNRMQQSNEDEKEQPEAQTSPQETFDETEIDEFFSKFQHGLDDISKQRKILLDCGANIASTVELFRETYPGGRDFIIHSFEIDSRLAPYFSPYSNHHLHCPVGVASKNGTMTAYTESVWSEKRGKNNGRDMQWGGGTLFVSEHEAADNITGGRRQLGVRPSIPVIDLSAWIQSHTSTDDYVILKLDVEGAEYDIVKKMLNDGTFEWVDKYYGEFHHNQDVGGWSRSEKIYLKNVELAETGHSALAWQGEERNYEDFEKMHPVKVPLRAPGIPGGIYSSCGDNSKNVAIAIAVGMNAKRARKLIDIVIAYRKRIPVALFIYGDFAELFPNDVKHWATRFHIGVREDGHFPDGHFEKFMSRWVRESLVSAELRLQELGLQPAYYLPTSVTHTIIHEAQKRGFRVIQPTYEFPPKQGMTLEEGNYYKYRDVERIPKALRNIHDALLARSGGFLILDSDLPDTVMNIVFLLDYLYENSSYNLVSVADCVSSSIIS